MAIGYVYIRFFILHITSRRPFPFTQWWSHITLSAHLIGQYLTSALIPFNHQPDHQLIPGIHAYYYLDSVVTPKPFPITVLGIIGITISIITLYLLFKSKYTLITFGLLWFLISIIPVLQFVPQNNLFSEQYLFLGVLGICIIFAELLHTFVDMLSKKGKIHRNEGIIGFSSFYLLIYIYFLYQYIPVWKNDQTLWSHAVSQNSTSSMSYTNLGVAYLKQKQWDAAKTAFTAAAKLKTDAGINWANLGYIAYMQGNNLELNENIHKAVSVEPNAYTYELAGDIFYEQNSFSEAEPWYLQAIALNPTISAPYLHLATIYHRRGEFIEAEKYYQQAIKHKYNYLDAYLNLGNLYFDQERFSEARQHYQLAQKIDPTNADVLVQLEKITRK